MLNTRGLSPLLFTLYTYECNPRHGKNSVLKFADDTNITGRISNSDETSYWEDVHHLAEWCTENNLLLNLSKTKELIIDLEKRRQRNIPLSTSVELRWSKCFRFLGISIIKNHVMSSHISTLVKKAQKRLYFLRKLKRSKFPCHVLINFYRGAIESILTGNITNWHGLCMADRRALQRVIKIH